MSSRIVGIFPAESIATCADRHAPAADGDRGRRSWCPDMPDTAGAEARAELPRLAIVFWFRQCDKENHCGREDRPLTVTVKLRSLTGLHPPGKVTSKQKENISFRALRRPRVNPTLAANFRLSGSYPCQARQMARF